MVIILGGSGYVGTHFLRFLRKTGIPSESISRQEVDYTQSVLLEKFLRAKKPDFLINCAGYTGKPNVDACEAHRWETLQGNAVLPGIIAQACRESGTPWAQISSGCIYNGAKSYHTDGSLIGFSEEDLPNFAFGSHCSFYSGTKALGEQVLGWRNEAGLWIPPAESPCYIWRLRIPFSAEASPRNYLTKILSYARLLDATNSISHLDDFVQAAIQCWQKKLPLGIYNLTNPGHITTRQITQLMKEEGERRNASNRPNPFAKNFDFFKNETEFMKLAAKTPRSNCVLDTTKMEESGLEMRPVLTALKQSLAEYV